MRQTNTKATLEPCVILEVKPESFTVVVRGDRNIGEMELTWTDYSCPGAIPSEDASWNGRMPEPDTKVLVLAEWTDTWPVQLVRAYIVGYIPYNAQRFSQGGYSAERNNNTGDTAPGDYVISTSSKSYYKLSSSGTITEECTPANYRKLTPANNTVYEVCENRHTHVSGYVERVTYNEYGNRGNKYVRALWSKLPKASEFNTEEQRITALSDAGNVVVLEEIGDNIASDFMVPGAENSIGKPVYKFSVIKGGVAIYSKAVDASGNVIEGNIGNRDLYVGNNFSIMVANTFRSVASLMSWVFGAATSAVSGIGSGVWDLVATRVNFRRPG